MGQIMHQLDLKMNNRLTNLFCDQSDSVITERRQWSFFEALNRPTDCLGTNPTGAPANAVTKQALTTTPTSIPTTHINTYRSYFISFFKHSFKG